MIASREPPPPPEVVFYALAGFGVGILYVIYSAGWAALCPFVGLILGVILGIFYADD